MGIKCEFDDKRHLYFAKAVISIPTGKSAGFWFEK
jgi:hypothetical protein